MLFVGEIEGGVYTVVERDIMLMGQVVGDDSIIRNLATRVVYD